jgi:S-adenosyl-L-methionine hydrolase (adenosine-forming)
MSGPLVTFLSDYGRRDSFVGLCHAVIAGIAPAARVIDITHDVAPQDVRHGATLLADCMPWLPPAVHLAVVDPGVGTTRRPVIVDAGGTLLVGPDNGLLWPAVQALGGPTAVFQLPVPAGTPRTFHGRDVFAPAAARLASGADPAELAAPLDPAGLVALRLPVADLGEEGIHADVLAVDRFGNLQLTARVSLAETAGWQPGARLLVGVGRTALSATLVETFAEVAPGEVAVLADAFGRLQVAVNRGSAAELLSARAGDPLRIRPRIG